MTVAGATLIGLTLGLLGSGGSILTVPVLTFLVGQDPKAAIAGSLGVVGAISLVAALPYLKQRSVDLFSVIWFGVPGMFGAYFGAFGSEYVSGSFQMLAFASLAAIAAVLMFRGNEAAAAQRAGSHPGRHGQHGRIKAAMDGLAVGAVTGFVGVGGGFLIVPALVILGGLPMRLAVGTSLVIIALKSWVGFAKYHEILTRQGIELDASTLAIVAAIGMVGSVAGSAAGGRWSPARLRQAFAVALIVVAAGTAAQSWHGAFGSPSEDGPPTDTSPATSAATDAAPNSTEDALFQRADNARSQLMGKLLQELSAALGEGGAPAAIEVCSNRAPAIAMEVSKDLGLRVGRTSVRLRNPANLPPAWAEPFLRNGGEGRPQRVRLDGSLGEPGLGVLFPIRLSKGCLGCHGNSDTISSSTQAALDRLYPADRATGFQEGDLRGWLWVEVPGD